MTGYQKSGDPLVQLQMRLGEVEATLRDLARPRPAVIPVLSADPPDTDPTNVWVLPDGRLRVRYRDSGTGSPTIREYTPNTPTGTAPPPIAAPAPTLQTYTTVWNAAWTASYRESGPQRTDEGADVYLYYGNSGSAFNGRNRSAIGFDYAAISSALAGSSIQSVRLYLSNLHSWWNSGSDIYFGIHNFTSEPSSWAGGGIPASMITKQHFGKPEAKWISLPLDFAKSIRDGWGMGVALEAPSDSREFYGYAAGVGSGQSAPRLEVTYVK